MNIRDQALIMSRARIHHRKRGTATNVKLALDLGLADTKEEAVRLCHMLGLYAWGKLNDTKLDKMTEHIERNEKC